MAEAGAAVQLLLVSYDADRAATVGAVVEDRVGAVVTTTADPRAVFDAADQYDCVVLEIPLEGMSADAFLAAVTDDPPAVPVVPVTSGTGETDAEAGELGDGAGETDAEAGETGDGASESGDVAGVDGHGGDVTGDVDELVERIEAVLAERSGVGGGLPPSLTAGTGGDTEYAVISEAAPIGLFTLDEDAVIRWANQVYMDTLDLAADELIGRPFIELIEAGYYDESIIEKYLNVVRELLSSETDLEQRSYTVDTYLPGGETLVHDVHTTLLPLDDGEFRGTVVAFRDVTTQKAYEQELERQNDRLNAFSSVVSHDLRNPLGIARGYLDLALEADEPDRDDLEAVQDALDRMEGLIDDLLRLAREGRTVEDPAVVDVGDVARRAWETVETGDATLDVTHPGVVLADEGRLRQLFENLYRNGVEHGTVPDRSLAITVGSVDDGQGFFVEDNGPGIPADHRDRAFDHGFTTTEAGTGFGLEIVRTIVEAHDWSVDVTEGDGGGARFEIRTGRRTPHR